jgi:hypothetical protein
LRGRDRAVCAGLVFDYDALVERDAERLCDDARYDVGSAACAERHDDGDRLARVILRVGCNTQEHCACGGEQMRQRLHVSFPPVLQRGFLILALWPRIPRCLLDLPSKSITDLTAQETAFPATNVPEKLRL